MTDVVEQIAEFVERWNGATADGNTFLIAAQIREQFARIQSQTVSQGTEVGGLVERLRARAKRVQSQIENSQRVVDLMQPELDRFDERAGHNVYATRLAVDHVSAIRTDKKELADWSEAADALTSLQVQVERMREALEDLLPSRLCGEGWNLPDNEHVAIDITFGKLRAARAAITCPSGPMNDAK